jgi:hypothetical protein
LQFFRAPNLTVEVDHFRAGGEERGIADSHQFADWFIGGRCVDSKDSLPREDVATLIRVLHSKATELKSTVTELSAKSAQAHSKVSQFDSKVSQFHSNLSQMNSKLHQLD